MKRNYLLISMLAFLLCSCHHKELCFDHLHMTDFEVKFDWTETPEANPRTMVLQIFRNDGSHYTTIEFVSREGGKFRIEAGEYKFLFHNGTISSLIEKGNNYYEYELTTKSQSLLAPMGRGESMAPPRPGDAKDEPIIDILEDIWGGRLEYVQVLKGVENQSVTLKPTLATSEYTVEVRGVKNLRDGIDISAALTGMAQSWRIYDNSLSEMTATVPFPMSRKDETTLEAHFITFGDAPDHTGKHTLSIYTSDKEYAHFDITDQVHNAPDSKHLYITVEGLELNEGGGMSPGISGWEDVEIDLPMQ